jgi:hypothetical protein
MVNKRERLNVIKFMIFKIIFQKRTPNILKVNR